ncbi:hypothetical protein [Mesorhizobium tianshanense]|uniref:Uncharacterized protein n=1 Tax=Mesorhizobium tianshanense TaxID=39844 RepID=A0A562NCD9_9HYPH|nr:hypothetical protein [Mesorhizobium tianshanense]TWI29787.1 hypothetical protein IQ26_04901 [Mesorhizobium tianshanense]
MRDPNYSENALAVIAQGLAPSNSSHSEVAAKIDRATKATKATQDVAAELQEDGMKKAKKNAEIGRWQNFLNLAGSAVQFGSAVSESEAPAKSAGNKPTDLNKSIKIKPKTTPAVTKPVSQPEQQPVYQTQP